MFDDFLNLFDFEGGFDNNLGNNIGNDYEDDLGNDFGDDFEDDLGNDFGDDYEDDLGNDFDDNFVDDLGNDFDDDFEDDLGNDFDDNHEFVITKEEFGSDDDFDAMDETDDGTSDSMFDYIYSVGESDNYETFDPSQSDPDMVIGNPIEASEHWHLQETSSTCAVAVQEFVLEELTGKEFNESDLTDIAEENGWYDNGTPPECTGNILEHMGFNVEKSFGNDISDIEDCLNNGGKVIVGLDADEVWYGESDDVDFGPGMDADHVVQVTGFDYTDSDNPMVIINDSGVLNGAAASVPLDDFKGAWEDSGCFMVEAYK